MDYSKVVGDIGVQVASEAAEASAALAKGIMDIISESSETTADDAAFPWIQKIAGTAFRVVGDKYLAKRHPGLGKVAASFGSAMNGAYYLDLFRRMGVRATRRAAERLQGQGNP